MFTDYAKAHEAMILTALAQFALDVSDGLHHPVSWEIEGRKALQDQARRLLTEAKALNRQH